MSHHCTQVGRERGKSDLQGVGWSSRAAPPLGSSAEQWGGRGRRTLQQKVLASVPQTRSCSAPAFGRQASLAQPHLYRYTFLRRPLCQTTELSSCDRGHWILGGESLYRKCLPGPAPRGSEGNGSPRGRQDTVSTQRQRGALTACSHAATAWHMPPKLANSKFWLLLYNLENKRRK